ncbi:hypothetical protein, partial [Phenylobacterium sp. CCH9-H3]|uniref:hypothetical protein n=2 Tax=unclassified Phenylobacterium TaxID=2640670 RepID=UPI000B07AD43
NRRPPSRGMSAHDHWNAHPAKGAADPIAEELAADPRAIALLQAWRSLPASKRNFFADLIRSAAQEPGDAE